LPPKDDDADFTRTLLFTKAPKTYAARTACEKANLMPIKTPNENDCRNEEILR
jgi:hypothetical protein